MTNTLPIEEIETLKAFACDLADAAAAVTLSYFKKSIGIDDKDQGEGFDPVTRADREAEAAIRELIEQQYPKHGIHGEEYGVKETTGDYEWVLDPIDGTRAFISGLPTWGTLIALKYKGIPLIGIIDQPYLKERYLGWTTGATLNGEPLKTRPCSSLTSATLSTTDPALFNDSERSAFDTLLGKVQLVRYSLDCYAYAVMSAGHIDIVVESGLKPYDMMALIPVVRGAGGIATNWEGNDPGECGRIIATGNATLSNEAVEILAAA